MVRRVKNLFYQTLLRLGIPASSGIRASHEPIRPAPAGPGCGLADLLGRPAINLDTPELQRFLAGKRVLVTGAGGSIGSEICRQMMRFCPQRVILVERAENNLFEIDRELRERWVGADIRPCIADVCDARRIGQIFAAENPQVVFHCAAHKHVPMMEHNPCEAIKNNIFGTKTVADAALAAGTAAFVLISTDKAVNPSSVMGATKRVAELYIQSLNAPNGPGDDTGNARFKCGLPTLKNDTPDLESEISYFKSEISNLNSDRSALRLESADASAPRGRTKFVAVRFGNVLGSSGSVVPIFQKQIEAGGPVTVTHPDMQRYFMTIPEASQLVMQAGAIGQGGQVLLLDMGFPVKIVDLARQLIARNGLMPDVDIQIQFSGIRRGEKLHEELSCADEQTRPTSHEKIRAWQLPPITPRTVARHLRSLSVAALGTSADAIAALSAAVPEYRPQSPAAKPTRQPIRLAASDAVEAA